jgi:hypothetical protein
MKKPDSSLTLLSNALIDLNSKLLPNERAELAKACDVVYTTVATYLKGSVAKPAKGQEILKKGKKLVDDREKAIRDLTAA